MPRQSFRSWPKKFKYSLPKGREVERLFASDNAKAAKSVGAGGYLGWMMYFAPARLSGQEVCPSRSPLCTAACLNTAGNGGMYQTVQQARIRKTKWFFTDPDGFLDSMVEQLAKLDKYTSTYGLKTAVRLNGMSDIDWEHFEVRYGGTRYRNVMLAFPGVMFYDYTKRAERIGKRLPSNYSLTFSASEENHDEVQRFLRHRKSNVAAVFERRKPLPKSVWGTKVIDGDKHDFRFLDPGPGIVVGLQYKLSRGKVGGKSSKIQGLARRGGFIVEENPPDEMESVINEYEGWKASQAVFTADGKFVGSNQLGDPE